MKNYYKYIITKLASSDTEINLKAYSKRIDKIRECAKKNTLLTISYIDGKGNRTKRMVEPYKLTDSDFWGYDINKDGIRRFKTKNIKGVKKSVKQFTPKWDIEV